MPDNNNEMPHAGYGVTATTRGTVPRLEPAWVTVTLLLTGATAVVLKPEGE